MFWNHFISLFKSWNTLFCFVKWVSHAFTVVLGVDVGFWYVCLILWSSHISFRHIIRIQNRIIQYLFLPHLNLLIFPSLLKNIFQLFKFRLYVLIHELVELRNFMILLSVVSVKLRVNSLDNTSLPEVAGWSEISSWPF